MKLTINISARDFDKANYVIGQSLKMWRDDPTDFELRMGTPLLESELKAAETLKNAVKKAFIREIKVGWKKPKTKLEGEALTSYVHTHSECIEHQASVQVSATGESTQPSQEANNPNGE